ncbi:DUF4349 domain-containing protein [Peribacillus sp. SCS-37]|uniref:DUF4349 domain-containing protein n=1 Tax=Paraperibacillus esterisolvens TaxID=3115296 RepID=UPI0039066702
MKWICKTLAAAVLIFTLAACSNDGSMKSESGSIGKRDSADVSSGKMEIGEKETETSESPPEKKIIYKTDIDAGVKNFSQFETALEKELASSKGYIVTKEVYSAEEYSHEGTFEIRVPQPALQSFLRRLEGIKDFKINTQSVKGEDVTEEYVDLSSRLKAKQAVEKRLYSFMEKAEETDGLLQISRDLGKIQEEIESIKGRMQYLDKNSDLSSVSLHVAEIGIVVPELDTKELNTWERSKKSFIQTVQGLAGFISGLVVFFIGGAPVLIPLLLIAWASWHIIKKRKHKG